MNAPEILLIEDNLNDAELAIRALKKGHPARNIVHLLDGEEALNWLFPNGSDSLETVAELPKVILLDLKLPKIDGFEVLKVIKSHPGTKLIPVVVLSSSAETKDIHQCYALYVNSYVVKPVDFDSYHDTISNLGQYWLVHNQQISAESDLSI